MGVEEEVVKELLFDGYRHLPIIGRDYPSVPSGPPPGQFSIYPNPATDKVSIHLDIEGLYPGEIELFDPEGRRIRTMGRQYSSGIEQTLSLDLSGLSPGNYYVRWIAEDSQEVQLLSIYPQ